MTSTSHPTPWQHLFFPISHQNLSCHSGLKPHLAFFVDSSPNSSGAWLALTDVLSTASFVGDLKN